MANRIAVFIDGGYADKIAEHEFKTWFDFGKLSDEMAQGTEHFRTYYYHCLPYQSNPPSQDEAERFSQRQRFFNALESLNRFEVRLGYLNLMGEDEKGKRIFQQKGVDVYMAIDIVQLALKRLITHAAILTADSDFVPALALAKNEGIVIRLYHSAQIGKTNKLFMCADERVTIDERFVRRIQRKK